MWVIICAGSKLTVSLISESWYTVKNIIVKEQWVEGSWHNACLRCILTDFERNYQIKIPSELASVSVLHMEMN